LKVAQSNIFKSLSVPLKASIQQIENKLTTKFFVKAPLRGAFTKNLGLV
jgi:hypothetical protein